MRHPYSFRLDVVEYSAADIIDMQCTPLVVQQIERGYLFFLVHGLYPSVSECVGLVTAYYIDAVEGDFGHNQLFSEDSLVSSMTVFPSESR